MANSKLASKSDGQLKELKASLEKASTDLTNLQGQFWGQGYGDSADVFSKSAETLSQQCDDIQAELDSRVQEQDENLTKEQKKSLEEQPKYPPANLAPADQPKPATQPVELSTEAQKQQQKDNKSSTTSTSTTSSSSSTHKA